VRAEDRESTQPGTPLRTRRMAARFECAMPHYDCSVPGHGQTISVRASTPEEAAVEAVRTLVKHVPPNRWTVDVGGHRVDVHAAKKVDAGSRLPLWEEYELTATLFFE